MQRGGLGEGRRHGVPGDLAAGRDSPLGNGRAEEKGSTAS